MQFFDCVCLNAYFRFIFLLHFFFFLFQIANHPLLVRRIYNDEDVARFSQKLYSKGVFGFECTFERVVQELKSYNDFSIHRVIFLAFPFFPLLFC